MTVELANYLIGLDKYVVVGDNLLEEYEINIEFPMGIRLYLSSKEDIDQSFLIDVKESSKGRLKVNLHHQDYSTTDGLLRIDYNSRHQNPFIVTDNVPDIFTTYAGQWLDDYPGHIHYVVDGYKPLVWAIPLENDDFPVKRIDGREDYAKTLKAFFEKINLKTNISINNQLIIQ